MNMPLSYDKKLTFENTYKTALRCTARCYGHRNLKFLAIFVSLTASEFQFFSEEE